MNQEIMREDMNVESYGSESHIASPIIPIMSDWQGREER